MYSWVKRGEVEDSDEELDVDLAARKSALILQNKLEEIAPEIILAKGENDSLKLARATQKSAKNIERPNQTFGPMPRKGCHVFAGLKFIVISSSPTDQEQKTRGKIPFSKPYLIKQICRGGGTVLNTDLDDQYWRRLIFYVIAEPTVISKTFLKALAMGKVCISHEWIVRCCRTNNRLANENYYLPAGRSIMNNEIIKWHGRQRLLRNWYFTIHSQNKFSREYAFWKSLLRMCGACVVTTTQIRLQNYPRGVLMIDNVYPVLEILELERYGLILYTTDWLIECLIHGEVMSHKKYSNFSWKKK